ncbi:MAG: sugar ABC transporter substrate-binding protein [Actinobacteria bacterium HGW-Actinobacteria-4]|nr:MAG: sugar ABC transporter substrate-binding protein [Actinobacteria bacterium HGW-Actinobacteria-4]
MKIKKHVLAAAAASLALLLAACTPEATPTESPDPVDTGTADEVLTIGLITKFPVDFFDIMQDAAREWDENEPGAKVIFAQGASGTDDEGVIAAIQSMVAQGVDAIAITPTSPNVAAELQKAVDAGIAVVLIDNDIPDWDGKSALVATDNYAGGVLAGEWLRENLPEGAKIAVMAGVLGNPSLDARVDGMIEGLDGWAEIVANIATDCDQTKGLNAGQDILTANPELDAIYAACGPPLIGALEAITAAGRDGQLITVGFDASPDEVAAIIAGRQTASIAQFPANMGSLGVQAAFDAARGMSIEANIDTGTALVTKDNAADFQ